MKVHVEYTDTFGGEANYCWVKRETLDLPDKASDLSIVRAAKSAIGLTGVRCRKEDFGNMIALYPYGYCTVLFITFDN